MTAGKGIQIVVSMYGGLSVMLFELYDSSDVIRTKK